VKEVRMGIVRVSTALSLDGYMAGPNHEMDWVFDQPGDPPSGLVDELIETTGSILAGRGSYDVGRGSTRQETSAPFGGRWSGPQFVLTHDPPDDEEDESITFLSGDIRDAVATAREAAGEKNVLILGANVADQCLDAGLVDDYVLIVLPVILGDGIPLFPAGRKRVDLAPIDISRSGQTVNLRYGVPD
jgi:dihydrofolate reductase